MKNSSELSDESLYEGHVFDTAVSSMPLVQPSVQCTDQDSGSAAAATDTADRCQPWSVHKHNARDSFANARRIPSALHAPMTDIACAKRSLRCQWFLAGNVREVALLLASA